MVEQTACFAACRRKKKWLTHVPQLSCNTCVRLDPLGGHMKSQLADTLRRIWQWHVRGAATADAGGLLWSAPTGATAGPSWARESGWKMRAYVGGTVAS